jgi:outer membrane protein assembly factor BamB
MKRTLPLWLSRAAVAAALVLALALPALADDWPQWRGPERTGISKETGWKADWSAGAPKVVWEADVGLGFSAVSVVGKHVFTMGNKDGKDIVSCLDADTGKPVWQHSYPCKPHDYPGSRCTPTVDGDSVYTLSNQGDLFCLNKADGKVKWGDSMQTVLGVKPPQWGFACSPLILGDKCIIDVGPVVALNKADGKVLWKAGDATAGYASPYAFTHGGKTLIASFNEHGPIVVGADDGAVIAATRWETSYGVNAVTPIVQGDTIFISSGYNSGAALFKLEGGDLKQVWRNKEMRNHANNCVLWNGHLYGFDGQVNEGRLKCIVLETGEEKWAERTVKAGALMLADGKLVCQSSNGDVVIVEASPDGYKELGRAPVLDKTCWTTPILSGGRIYARNNNGRLVCLDVSGK